MGGSDFVRLFEVGDSAGNFNDFEIGTSGKIKAVGGEAEKFKDGWRERDESPDLVGGERRVVCSGIIVAILLASNGLCYVIFYNIVCGKMFNFFMRGVMLRVVWGAMWGRSGEEVTIGDFFDGETKIDAVE